MNTKERTAKNFIKKYGSTSFDRLIARLGKGESGQSIADEFNVSRERVRQWKNAFGQVFVTYRLHPEIAAILAEKNRKNSPPSE